MRNALSAGAAPLAGDLADRIDCVIFDCDGVLVDSEPIALALLRDTIAGLGLDLTLETVQREFQGRSLPSVVARLSERHGIRVPHEALEAMSEALLARFSAELRPIEGMPALLDRLARPFCVASSSHVRRLAHALAVTGLAPRFGPRVFSADAVARGKPAPDLLLHAAQGCRVAPERCLVVEDSVAGVEAAVAAGMPVLGFTAGGHAGAPGYGDALRAAGARDVARDAGELARLMGPLLEA